MKLGRAIIVPVALVLGLAGCSASVHSSSVDAVPTSQISKEATKLIQAQLTQKITISCGSGSTELVDNKKLKCTLDDITDKLTYGTTVTLSKVKGYSYHEAVVVANKPNK